jgi:hypothetical protein
MKGDLSPGASSGARGLFETTTADLQPRSKVWHTLQQQGSSTCFSSHIMAIQYNTTCWQFTTPQACLATRLSTVTARLAAARLQQTLQQ